MSISSQMSDTSVSFQGNEIPLADALDEVFTELQGFLNSLHCYTRDLAIMKDRNEDYEVELKQVLVIGDTIESMSDLFKDLKLVAKQVIGPPPKDQKEAMKTIVDDHRAKKKREKEMEKEEQKLSASTSSNP